MVSPKDVDSVKAFEVLKYNTKELTKFVEGRIRREGVINKRNLETLENLRVVYRPFRRVTWNLESYTGSIRKRSSSFIDEQLSSRIEDSDHRLLLWRPRYADLQIVDLGWDDPDIDDNIDSIKEILDDLMRERWTGQELDEELRPKLRSLQSDPLTSIAFIIPRSPHGLKREEKILVKRKEIHSFILASSLVTNSDPKDIMLSAEIGNRVFVETVFAQYRDLSNDSLRFLYLETPGARSLIDTQRAGKALMRICDLYPECIDLIV